MLLLVCVWYKTSGTQQKINKIKNTTAKLLIFKCTQWLTWVDCLLSLQNYGCYDLTNPEWCRNSLLKPLCNKSKSCSAICCYYYYYYFLGGGGVVLYSSEVEWKEMDHDHEYWSAILWAQEERERVDERTKEGSKVSLFWNKAWL